MPGKDHTHSDEIRKRVWLEVIHDEPSKMKPHAYCSICGCIRQMNGQGKQPSHFIEGFSRLIATLPKRARLVEVQARLIVKGIESDETLSDSYSSPYSLQIERYVEIVRGYRPDIDEDLILRSLSRERANRSRAHMDDTDMAAEDSRGPYKR
jgi:hypothetical protein